ncbi:MAG: MotA/TolQ/ExbB proton channel family protein [Gammaproteobacteria bacterium]|nr:MotA/TolQ/ExbB proton channel family protein [Gammaproteobacteria bacterium]MBP6480657.1 MotA/TolQ/ExbB proton channel family protein [Pseudomonadales bacterium]MBP7908635.1 MotA/TolQ/ExbB proton channel family protein [Pseudomonadales bacterium]
MMNLRGLVLGFGALCLLVPAVEATAAVSMGELQRQAQQMREREAKIWSQREAEQRAEMAKQEQMATDAVARRNRAEARSNSLSAEFDQRSERIEEMRELLHQYQGNLGELFGVTRQVAGDSATVLNQSLLTVQFPAAEGEESREELMRRIAAAKELPSFAELERMWFELQREMTENGKVRRFTADVKQPDGTVAPAEVVRVGPFTAVSDGNYLAYDPTQNQLSVMPRQLGPRRTGIAEDLQEATEGHVKALVDPSRGPLLGMVSERPNLVERIQHGEVVGYVIVLVGLIGALNALGQYIYLFITRASVAAQLRNLSNPNKNNPLGRVLLAFRGDGKEPSSAEVAELRLSEAVLREVPKLQRFQSFLRLLVAAGPLLGLVGTVIGMIITFHAITASGSSDPKLMAHGIGQAMIATVLGLGIAIPLLFLNQGLTALSNGITQILDEQSQALLADQLAGSESRKA